MENNLKERMNAVRSWYQERGIKNYGAILSAMFPHCREKQMIMRVRSVWMGRAHTEDVINLFEESIRRMEDNPAT